MRCVPALCTRSRISFPLRSAVAATIVEIVGAAAAVAAAAAAQHEDQEQEQDIAITASTTEHVCDLLSSTAKTLQGLLSLVYQSFRTSITQVASKKKQ